MRNTVLVLILLLVVVVALLNLTSVQTYVAQRAAVILADKLKTRVAIQGIRIDFLNHIHIQGLYIEDQAHDTLLYAGDASVRITDWFFVKKEVPVIKYVGLENTYAHLYRKRNSDIWNYQFVVDAFDTGPKKTKTQENNDFEIDLDKVKLANVRFHMDDAWVGSDMDFDVGDVVISANDVNLAKKLIDIDKIDLKKVAVQFRDYDGGRPPRPKKPVAGIDTTAFNPGNWVVKLSSLQLEDCYFGLESGSTKPVAGEFDASHMQITGINIDARKLSINGDTLTADLRNLSAKDRCGLVIKKFKAEVTVSPNASICKNLLLETNRSKLQHYYAMHYTRFPDFTDYINKVVMVANLQNSSIDSRDIAVFAPALKEYPTILKISGKVKGTVSNFNAQQLNLTDGNSVVKGNLKMTGLPDINTTFIDYQDGELMTSGPGIFKYAPSLKSDPNIALEKLSHIYFKGNFTGYINNFATNSVLVTNLGTVKSNINLRMPGGKAANAVYSGTVNTDNFNLGALLRQPDLGSITLNAKVSGHAFDPKIATIQLNGTVQRFDLMGYSYKNINLEGSIEKNKFNGNMLVDDPNLALAFYGDIDFSGKQVNVKAKANLLKSNFAALKLTKDSIMASADFDLDCVGSNIDNFTGFAKLYNINLLRNGHRLDVDSVYVNSSFEGDKQTLTVNSNVLTGNVTGDFTLSKLGNSVQYYLSGYLPAYIKQPSKEAPEQNLSLTVTTHEVDSLLGVLVSDIQGFNNSTITGTLNTASQQLVLNATIPYGRVSTISVNNLLVTANGNFSTLSVNAKTDNIAVGKSVHGSLDVNTTVGNNAMTFKVATRSAGDYGTATINGKAVGHGDTLDLELQPSEFYFNNIKWDIANASATISDKYLFVHDVKINSGFQSLHVYSKRDYAGGYEFPTLYAELKDFDIASLANLAGMKEYRPDGRINGKIQVDDLYNTLVVAGDIKATDVKLGDDTVGNINISGSYNAAKNIVSLNGQSGIYRGNASLTASGNLSFDSVSNQRVDGSIQFNNTPLQWVAPFTTGIISDLSGNLNGDIKIKGIASSPDVDGNVKLADAHLRFDFLGPIYSIPAANLKVTSDRIDLGTITLLDGYSNTATLTGFMRHRGFQDMQFNLNLNSQKFEIINLEEQENSVFYGNLIGKVQNLTVRGPVDDLRIRIDRVSPAAKSHLFLPISSGTGLGTYSYVFFKEYGKEQAPVKKAGKSKLSLSIEAVMNELAEITLVLDPATGDAINASGTGTVRIDMPAGNDMRMSGKFLVSQGDYTFTLKQLAFKRNFKLDKGSEINFNGLLDQTQMNVTGVYTTRARLIDLLNAQERTLISSDNRELSETRTPQDVDILLFMRGTLASPSLTFKLDLPNKSSQGTLAYTKLQSINQNDQQLFNQVASLLLINTFVSDGTFGGEGGSGAVAGSISNVSQILSSTASNQLTNILGKITGNENLSVDFKYKNYSYNENSSINNRNEFSFGLRQSLFNDRLSVEVGSSYDWGKPTSATTSASNFNPVGDFRLQYQFREGGDLRGYLFRTGSYDVFADRSVNKGGVGLNWSRSFNSLAEFFQGRNYASRLAAEKAKDSLDAASRDNRDGGTW